MNHNFRDYNPDQPFLFPPALSDLIAPEDPLHVFSQVVDRFDLTAFYTRYSDEGSPAYHPCMMVKVLAYAYMQGLRSSRRIASLVRYDVRFMYLAGRQQPDFRTLSDFRLRHLPEFSLLFQQIVALCQDLGLVALKHVALDGTKMEVPVAWTASRTAAQLQAEFEALQTDIQNILQEAEAADRAEDACYGPKRQGGELPADLADARTRQQKILAALKALQERGDAKINLTDPEARVMKHYGGKQDWSYNAQIAVDSQDQVIVAAEVVNDCNDEHQLAPMYQRLVATTGQAPAEISADSGYATGASQLFVAENGLDAYMPDQRQQSDQSRPPDPYSRDHFTYDAGRDVFLCPAGQTLKLIQKRLERGVPMRVYRCSACPACPHQAQCLRRGKRRTLKVTQAQRVCQVMRAKLDSPEGRRRYRKRLATVEPVIGHLKCILGFRSFLLRGLEKVQGEFNLMVCAHNLRKICSKLAKSPVLAGSLAVK